jgi:hypothetical protein
VLCAIGRDRVNEVVWMLQKNIFVHKELFGRHLFRDTLTSDEWSNTNIEGTNNALKYCDFAVNGSMDAAKATGLMLTQDLEKHKIKNALATAAFHSTPLWTNNATAKDLVHTAECKIQREIKQARSYASLRMNDSLWYVVRLVDWKAMGVAPKFDRLCTVTMDSNFYLHCSCRWYEVWGWFCCHIQHVGHHYRKMFTGFTSNDVNVRWWKAYYVYMVARSHNKQCRNRVDLVSFFKNSRSGDSLPGPKLPEGCVCVDTNPANAIGIDSSESFKCLNGKELQDNITDRAGQPVSTLLNYSQQQEANIAIKKFGGTHAMGLTQELVSVDKEDSDPEIDFESQETVESAGKVDSNTWYQFSAPTLKELVSLYEHRPSKEKEEFLARWKSEIASVKAKMAAEFPYPAGKVVSSSISHTNKKRKSDRQNPY